MDITGAAAIVTAGATGVGEAIARRLAADGVHVVIVGRQQGPSTALARELSGRHVNADAGDTDGMQQAIDVAAELGPLRVLVNAAGMGWSELTVQAGARPAGLDGFLDVLNANLVGTFNAIRLAAAAMSRTAPSAEGERGAIVNIASVAAFDGQRGQAAYAAAKGGVVAMTLPLARDLAELGIRVNTIAHGPLASPLQGLFPEAERDELASTALFPRRLCRPDDVASLAMELLTNSYLNGETVRLDAGTRLPPG